MRALMRWRYEPWLILYDATPDGCAEIALEVNGHLVATNVLVAGELDWYARLETWWRCELVRNC